MILNRIVGKVREDGVAIKECVTNKIEIFAKKGLSPIYIEIPTLDGVFEEVSKDEILNFMDKKGYSLENDYFDDILVFKLKGAI